MKMMIVVVLALVAVSAAVPVSEPREPPKIINYEFEQQPEGSYSLKFQTEDGINRVQHGTLRTAQDDENKPHDIIAVDGSYSYPGPNGEPEVIEFYADETGFHATGKSIPQASRR